MLQRTLLSCLFAIFTIFHSLFLSIVIPLFLNSFLFILCSIVHKRFFLLALNTLSLLSSFSSLYLTLSVFFFWPPFPHSFSNSSLHYLSHTFFVHIFSSFLLILDPTLFSLHRLLSLSLSVSPWPLPQVSSSPAFPVTHELSFYELLLFAYMLCTLSYAKVIEPEVGVVEGGGEEWR